MSQAPPEPHPCDITIFETEDGRTRVEVRYERENVWLTQKLMGNLYECSTDNISLHLANIYADRELDPAATTEESSAVQKEGNREVRRRIGHLINIADLTGRSLKWDPVKEEFAGCDAANRLRSRAMRAPWRM